VVPRAATESAAGYLAANTANLPAIPLGDEPNPFARVVAAEEPFTSEDVATDERAIPELRETIQHSGFHGVALVQLRANDQLVGSLTVMDTRIRRFTEDEIAVLGAFADQASLALEKARLLAEAEQERERLEALNVVASRLAGVHEPDELLDLIVN